MMLTRRVREMVVAMAMIFSAAAMAEVTADEAKQLGGTVLTAWGAERAGNKDGTIPEYTGKEMPISSKWDSKNPGRIPDPYNEKPLFTITAQNVGQHADRLPDGLKEVFKKYPDYRMDIYPSHRTKVYPKYVLDNTLKNATSCKAVDQGLNIQSCYGGIPFPIPKTGNQVMWNKLLAYENVTWQQPARSWIVPNSGGPVLTGDTDSVQNAPFFDPKKSVPAVGADVYSRIWLESWSPARTVGLKYVIIDYVDSVNVGRRVYTYVPGQRRVKLAPDLAYDTPSPYSGGASTIDEAKVFLGAQDRYDFKLIGKVEKYIPYNNFAVTDGAVCPEDKIISTKHFPNPDCVRWELHRVWMVKATLKPGYRHIYKTRVFYWDEDSYAAGLGENYDATGNLYRVTYAIFTTLPDGGSQADATHTLDLQTGTWSGQGMLVPSPTTASHQYGAWAIKDKPESFYSPEAMAGSGIR